MDRFEVMKLFLRVAEAGSFSQAARQTGIVQSTASKQISTLEKRLGTQLIRRTSRGLTLTSAGKHYYEEALRLRDAVEGLEDAVTARDRSPSGLLRITCPPAFAPSFILPRLPAFLADNPDLSFDFVVSQHVIDLVEHQVDVAIRIGKLEDSELRYRRVGTSEEILVASTDYLKTRGEPMVPEELVDHSCIVSMRFGKPRPWSFRHDGKETILNPSAILQSDDVELTRVAVKSSIGIAYAPGWLFEQELATGEVRQLLRTHACTKAPISAVWAGDRALPRRAELFIDFLADTCSAQATLRNR